MLVLSGVGEVCPILGLDLEEEDEGRRKAPSSELGEGYEVEVGWSWV